MSIEELVKKYVDGTTFMFRLHQRLRAALTEQAETHAIELRAYEATVQNLEQRIQELKADNQAAVVELACKIRKINELEAQRVRDGMAQRPYAWAWEQHAWVVTAHGKHRGIRKSMDVCQPPIQTQESDYFIRMFPLYEHTTERVPAEIRQFRHPQWADRSRWCDIENPSDEQSLAEAGMVFRTIYAAPEKDPRHD